MRDRREAEREIEEIVHRETRAWDTRDLDLLMSVFHPDMVWPWPPTPRDHDPADWVLEWGRYDDRRWRAGWQRLFDTHELAWNRREIRKIELSAELDGAFAVVDIDTCWRGAEGDFRWQGRTCKIYTLLAPGPDGRREWKMTCQVGVLDYGP